MPIIIQIDPVDGDTTRVSVKFKPHSLIHTSVGEEVVKFAEDIKKRFNTDPESKADTQPAEVVVVDQAKLDAAKEANQPVDLAEVLKVTKSPDRPEDPKPEGASEDAPATPVLFQEPGTLPSVPKKKKNS